MFTLKNVKVAFKGWVVDGYSSTWGRMKFEVIDATLKDVSNSMLSIYQLNGKTIIEIESFILNNVSNSLLFESSLESIIESVLSVINDEDIVVLQDFNISNTPSVSNIQGVSSDFLNSDFSDDYVYDDLEEDEYTNDNFSVGVSVEDADSVDYYDDMNFDIYDDYDEDEYDEDDDF